MSCLYIFCGFFGACSFSDGALLPSFPMNSMTTTLLLKAMGFGTGTFASVASFRFLNSFCAQTAMSERVSFLTPLKRGSPWMYFIMPFLNSAEDVR